MAHELCTSSLSEKPLTPFIVIISKLAYTDFQVTIKTYSFLKDFGETGFPYGGQFCNKPIKLYKVYNSLRPIAVLSV